MAIYVILGTLTEQGVKTIKEASKRGDKVKALAKKCGVTVKELYWTLGQYDTVGIFEAPDDAAMTALGLSIAALGNVRTQTLRAFNAADMKSVIGKLG